jgi:hypothetical protein
MTTLSKSKIMNHRQCPKRLWLEINQPKLAVINSDMQSRFDVGNQVGALARAPYPDGVMIDTFDRAQQLAETARALAGSPRPVFEATFLADDVVVRADLLLPDADGYRMVEVKSSTAVKPYHLDDAAIQYWVANQSGVPITSIEVACIDNTFVYQGDGDYAGLLKPVDVSVTACELASKVPGWIHAARQTLAGGKPAIDVGKQCRTPYGCPFLDACTAESPHPKTPYPVEMLPRVGKLADELRSEGINDVRDIPPGRLDSTTQERVRRISISGQAELSPLVAESMRRLGYPRHFIDFETINPAVPLWSGTHPYEALPFQWSCHTEEQDGTIAHHEFLASGTDDPRRAFTESLAAALSRPGPVFVYKAGTERTHMQTMAERFPDLAPALNEAIEWIIDLLPMTQLHYYHPDMMGSWSIKKVLPTIAPELAYDTLEVGGGTQAMQVFKELLNPVLSPGRRASLRTALLGYCERDTLAMVKLTHFFKTGDA